MNLQNIVSAGQMMAIVVALLGAFDCGTAYALSGGMVWDMAFGAAFVACGLALTVLFGRVARRSAFETSDSTDGGNVSGEVRLLPLGRAILVIGTLVVLLGGGGAAADWSSPFAWMMAIVGLAIFIDALCLHISLSRS
jgi:hypothetical protein